MVLRMETPQGVVVSDVKSVDNYLFIVFEETRVKNLIQNYQKKIFLFDTVRI
jgi:hypothetical protein